MLLNEQNVIISGEVVIENVTHLVDNKFIKCNSSLNSKSWNTTQSDSRCPECFIGQKFKYPNNESVFILKSFTKHNYTFECGHTVTDCVFSDLILITNTINPMQLKKTKTFSVSKNTETVILEGIEYQIANLLKSGILNQMVVLLGYDDIWHEIEVLNLGADDSNLINFKNFVELHNLKLSDLITIKKSKKVIDYKITHDDHVELSKSFPQFDYVQIGKLDSYFGEKSSIYNLRKDLTICTDRGLTIEQWISELEELKSNYIQMGKPTRTQQRIIQLGHLGLKLSKETGNYTGNGIIISEHSVENDTDEQWNSYSFLFMPAPTSVMPQPTSVITQPTKQLDIEEVIEEVIEEQKSLPAEPMNLPVKKPVSLETIGGLTPDRISELHGLKDQQNEIIKQNPFVFVTDKKSLEIAKKQRAILLKASTAIDGTSGIQATAKKYLNTFKSTLDSFLSSTAKITREAYDNQNSEIVRFENAEALKLAEEQRLKVAKINERTSSLFAVPMVFNGTMYQIGTLYILPSQIESATDEEFKLLLVQAIEIKKTLDAAAEIAKSKDAEIEELKRKLAELTAPVVNILAPVINNPAQEVEVQELPKIPNELPQTPKPIQEAPNSLPKTPVTNNRFKANTEYFIPNPENVILNKFDLEHVELISSNPINPAFLKCRAYFFEGNRRVAERLNEILNDTDVAVKKSVRIAEMCKEILSQQF